MIRIALLAEYPAGPTAAEPTAVAAALFSCLRSYVLCCIQKHDVLNTQLQCWPHTSRARAQQLQQGQS
jgi:hypothetical protein